MFGYLQDAYNLIRGPRPRDPELPRNRPMLLVAFAYLRTVKFLKWFIAAFFAYLARQLFTSTVSPFTAFIFQRWNMAATRMAVGVGIPQPV